MEATLPWPGLPSVVLAISHPIAYGTLPKVIYVCSGLDNRFGPHLRVLTSIFLHAMPKGLLMIMNMLSITKMGGFVSIGDFSLFNI
jgi:hypothetical protein